ncbi:MAG: HEAT repeat domain-containing protein [Pirellulaceae bacterium]
MRSQDRRGGPRALAVRVVVLCVITTCFPCAFAYALRPCLPRLEAGEVPSTEKLPADSFRGRPISEWVTELGHGPVKELEEAGPDGLAVWEHAARDAEAVTWVQHAMFFRFRNEPWVTKVYIAMLDGPPSVERSLALDRLNANPTVRSEAASHVVKKVREWSRSSDPADRQLVEQALDNLVGVDPLPKEAAELVRELWSNADARVFLRWKLLALLGHLGEPGVSIVMDIYRDPDAQETDLSRFSAEASVETIEALAAASQVEDTARRRLAALLISHAARDGISATRRAKLVEPTCRLLKDSDVQVRRYALEAIPSISREQGAEQTLPVIAQLMSNEDQETRFRAAQTLVAFGDAALPYVRKAAQDKDADTRVSACAALANMEPFPQTEIDVLLSLANDEHPHVRGYAVFALGESHSDAPAVSAALVKATHDPETSEWAVHAIGELGSAAGGIVLDELHKRLQSDDLRERLDAATALWEIRGDVEKVLPVARDIARDDRGVTASGYGATTRIVDGVRVEQQHPFEDPLAARAAQLLGKMGAAAKPAVGDLVKLLAHPNSRARTAALLALGEMGPAAAEALPALQEIARQADNRWQYIPILKNIDPAAAAELEHQLNDRVPDPMPRICELTL